MMADCDVGLLMANNGLEWSTVNSDKNGKELFLMAGPMASRV